MVHVVDEEEEEEEGRKGGGKEGKGVLGLIGGGGRSNTRVLSH